MRLLAVGLNHRCADVSLRERLAFDGPKLQEGLKALRALPEVQEVAVLSTCNRVEIYAAAREPQQAAQAIKGFLSSFHQVPPEDIKDTLYVHTDQEAVRHVFRVASSLDSMVVGEPQILGQLKEAFQLALQERTSGVLLNRLLKKAISVAKRVRTETRIAENAVSISFAAVELAQKIFTDLGDKAVMLLGAGEMAELAARHFISAGVRHMVVANRTYERGLQLAQEFRAQAVRFEEFLQAMLQVDIVLCSTGAPQYVLSKAELHEVMLRRKQRPMFIIDISVPRNIDPACQRLDNVYLYDVDDLQGVVDANLGQRKKEAQRAEEIVAQEVEVFERWRDSLQATPTIVALRRMAEEVKERELRKLLNRVQLDEAQKEAVSYMATAIVNKLLHPPTVALKNSHEDRQELIALLRKLYSLQAEQ
jgi:glutamyl-tRNA reductase